jgi:hypothetical protein
MDIDSRVEKRPFVLPEERVTVVTLSPAIAERELGIELEHEKRSPLYIFVLWLVSFWAMITNLSQALFLKIAKRKKGTLRKILWDMGRDPEHISSFAVDRFSRFNHEAKYGAAGWRALKLFYNYHSEVLPRLNGNLEGFVTRFWTGKMQNRQAVTNRLKVTSKLLAKAFSKFINEPEVRIVSVASGSAQAVVEAMKLSPQKVRAILIDIDRSALEEASRLVKAVGLEERFSFVYGPAAIVQKVCADFKPHIIEMIGFLDYRPKEQAIKLIKRIHNYLPQGGIFLTCNIRKNPERAFLSWALLWPLIYRNERQLSEIVVGGGFSPEDVDIIYEPFRIHGIAVCRK